MNPCLVVPRSVPFPRWPSPCRRGAKQTGSTVSPCATAACLYVQFPKPSQVTAHTRAPAATPGNTAPSGCSLALWSLIPLETRPVLRTLPDSSSARRRRTGKSPWCSPLCWCLPPQRTVDSPGWAAGPAVFDWSLQGTQQVPENFLCLPFPSLSYHVF